MRHRYPDGILSSGGTNFVGGFTPITAQRLAGEIAIPALPADLRLIHATAVTRRG